MGSATVAIGSATTAAVMGGWARGGSTTAGSATVAIGSATVDAAMGGSPRTAGAASATATAVSARGAGSAGGAGWVGASTTGAKAAMNGRAEGAVSNDDVDGTGFGIGFGVSAMVQGPACGADLCSPPSLVAEGVKGSVAAGE